MPRILGVDIPNHKPVEIALASLLGIGRTTAAKVLGTTQIDSQKRAKDLTDEEVARLTQTIQSNYKVEGELRREISANIKRLIDIGSYRGLRHKKGLPVRGQRSRTNARSRKGPRPRVGVRKRLKSPAGDSRSAGRSNP